jgi:putative peptide zinc metalloprotease protein
MSVSVFSKNWYRVENLKPKLKVQIDISSQIHRNERWYVLRDTISGTVQLFSSHAYLLIGMMDGQHTLNEMWEESGNQLEKDMPTQDEVVTLITSLHQADMIHLNIPANAKDLFHRKQSKSDKKRLQKVQSPMSLQLPLFDPTKLLDKLCPVLERFINWRLWLVYGLFITYALVIAAQNYEALTSNLSDRVLAAENLLLLWFLYPLIKILHELGHAFCVRYYGGQVSEVGVMFLVFFPMPYVNASESASFASKYQRIMVSASGVIVELFIAAVALIIWNISEAGFLKALLFNIVFMAGISTLLFNGNPLLKFDAYFALSDYLEIPNLAKKATSYWGYLCKRYMFNIKSVMSPAVDIREAYWLFFYNMFAFAYRLFISISIIIFVGQKYFILGILLAIWAFTSGWLMPFSKTVSKPFTDNEFKTSKRNPIMVMVIVTASFWILLFEIPLPYSVTVSGVSWVNEKQRLYAGESGFIDSIVKKSGEQVAIGETLINLKNYELEDKLAVLNAQLQATEARLQASYADRAKFLLIKEEKKRLEREHYEIQTHLEQTKVTSLSPGKVVLSKIDSFQGGFLKRGELVGYVLSADDKLTLKVLIPEGLAEQVLADTNSIDVRPASDRQVEFNAQMLNVTPQVTKELPSVILSTEAGGDLVIDPSKSDAPTAVENFVLVRVVTDESLLERVEERFFVKFNLIEEPIFWRVYRSVRRSFLEQFNV